MLHELQEAMRSAIWDRDPAAESLIGRHAILCPGELIAIYRGSILGGLTKALGEAYPVCRRLVGERFFDAMVARYVQREPSYAADLNLYGATLADFIEDFEPAAGLPYLADVVRLEWAWQKTWYTETGPALEFAELGRVPESQRDGIRFRLAPGTSLIESSYPLLRIWNVNQEDYRGDQTVDLAEGGVRLLIFRKGRERYMHRLEEAQWLLLSESARGRSLGELWPLLEETGVASGSLLGNVLARGWFTGFELATDPQIDSAC